MREKDRWKELLMHIDVSTNLLLIFLIHPSVCICLMNRILRLTVSRLNGRSKTLHAYLFLCSYMYLNKSDRARKHRETESDRETK